MNTPSDFLLDLLSEHFGTRREAEMFLTSFILQHQSETLYELAESFRSDPSPETVYNYLYNFSHYTAITIDTLAEELNNENH